jgi:Flp pilus assembly protein TadG
MESDMPNFPTNNRRGNYMMTMGAMAPILMGFAALSVDVSYINIAQVQAQHVADAASHGAFIGFRFTNDFGVGNDAAQLMTDENLIGDTPGTLVSVRYGEWDFGNRVFTPNNGFVNAAEAVVQRTQADGNPLDLFFAPMLGRNTWDVRGVGVTAGRSRQIVIVQDVSCSFDNDIDNSRDADVAFLNYMAANPYPDDLLGMTLFGGRTWYPVLQPLASIQANMHTGGSVDGKPNGMLARFQSVDYCDDLPKWSWAEPRQNECNTTQARGLIQARDEFIARGDRREFQAVILISDGHPNSGLTGDDSFNGKNGGKADSEMAANQLWGKTNGGADARTWSYKARECRYTWKPDCGTKTNRLYSNTYFDGGVHVWTVTFKNGGGDFSWMGTLVKGMGRAYETPDASELDDIMIEIASSIPVVLAE